MCVGVGVGVADRYYVLRLLTGVVPGDSEVTNVKMAAAHGAHGGAHKSPLHLIIHHRPATGVASALSRS